MTHICHHCKNQFQPRRLDQVYCRQSCRQGAYIRRKGHEPGKSQNSTTASPQPGFDLSGLIGNIPPETLVQLLSVLAQNPSLTDKLTGNVPPSPEKAKEEVKKPSQNVSDGSGENLNKHGKFMEDSWRNNGDKKDSSWEQHGRFMGESWELHASEYDKSVQKSVKDSLNAENTEVLQDQNKSSDVFSNMIKQGLTINIGPSGYVRSLFPHWDNKEWYLSLHVNQKMLLVFEQLRMASYKGIISYKVLSKIYRQINEFSSGLYVFLLPQDYPFVNFLRLLAARLCKLVERANEKTEIKFRVPDDLEGMMIVLKVQLESKMA